MIKRKRKFVAITTLIEPINTHYGQQLEEIMGSSGITEQKIKENSEQLQAEKCEHQTSIIKQLFEDTPIEVIKASIDEQFSKTSKLHINEANGKKRLQRKWQLIELQWQPGERQWHRKTRERKWQRETRERQWQPRVRKGFRIPHRKIKNSEEYVKQIIESFAIARRGKGK